MIKYFILTLLFYFTVSLICIKLDSQSSSAKKYDAIIVLGNSPNRNNTPNPFLKQRIEKAVQLFNDSYSDKIILSGGTKNKISEANIMEKYCLNKGIPSSALFKENDSMSTKQNLKYSNEILEKLNLQSGIVITNRHHVKRTRLLAASQNLDNFEILNSDDNWLTCLFYLPLKISEELKISKMGDEN